MNIEMIRLRSELVALEVLTVGVVRDLQRKEPALRPALQQLADRMTAQSDRLPVQANSAEEADLLASEFQEAWQRLMQRVLLPQA